MFKTPTLHIDCDGLSKKSIAELADELSMFFFAVDVARQSSSL